MSDDYTEYYNHCFIRCHERAIYSSAKTYYFLYNTYTYYLDYIIKNVIIYYTFESQLLESRGE